jgi:hypothetical protein
MAICYLSLAICALAVFRLWDDVIGLRLTSRRLGTYSANF